MQWMVCQLTATRLRAQESWLKNIPGVGTFSSPRVTDLNGDGIGDVIFGAGRLEFDACDSAIIALNGKNGKLLWKNSSPDQIFGSAALKDLNGDGTMDVVIGGRAAEMRAINGRNGKIIWKFDGKILPKKAKRWYNFYNPQFIPDQDGDGVDDIIVSNGGNVLAKPYDSTQRYSGELVVLSAKNGTLLAEALMPDRKETYMSVSVSKDPNSDDQRIIFGTGGETLGGHLYVGSLKNLMAGNLDASVELASSAHRGFIAPAVWVDINNDSIYDVVDNSVDGRLLAFDGKTLQPLWTVTMPGTEVYSSIAVGYFTKDAIPDFFVSYAKGVWPELFQTKQFMTNGKTGQVEFVDSLGYYQTSTPVVVDLNNDGVDEAFMSLNYTDVDSLGLKLFFNTLVAISFESKEVIPLYDGLPGHNIATTPWIGDINNDGMLDIVAISSNNKRKTYSFDGLAVKYLKTEVPITKPIKWGAYMGSRYDGVFTRE